jgi:hypothetical protein
MEIPTRYINLPDIISFHIIAMFVIINIKIIDSAFVCMYIFYLHAKFQSVIIT